MYAALETFLQSSCGTRVFWVWVRRRKVPSIRNLEKLARWLTLGHFWQHNDVVPGLVLRRRLLLLLRLLGHRRLRRPEAERASPVVLRHLPLLRGRNFINLSSHPLRGRHLPDEPIPSSQSSPGLSSLYFYGDCDKKLDRFEQGKKLNFL